MDFAFGFGADRLAMLLYEVNDLRLFLKVICGSCDSLIKSVRSYCEI